MLYRNKQAANLLKELERNRLEKVGICKNGSKSQR